MVRILNSGNERLYNIKEDPTEEKNRVAKEPELAAHLRELINNQFPYPLPSLPTYVVLSTILVEEGYKGFNIILYGDKYYGLDQKEGAFDINKVDRKEYKRFFIGKSVDEVKHLIDQSIIKRAEDKLAPKLVVEGYKGLNIISDGDKFYGLAQDEVAVDINKVNKKEYRHCFVGNSIEEVKRIINQSLITNVRSAREK